MTMNRSMSGHRCATASGSAEASVSGMTRRLIVIAAGSAVLAPAPALAADRTGANMSTAFDHEFVAIDGAPMPLAAFRGRVLLAVNVASFCGFTRQYAGLQALWRAYEDKGLVVLGIPSNDFGAQEPGSNAEIASFCQGAFDVTFPLTEKQTVKGAAAHPFYRWARTALGTAGEPHWNFHKILIGRDGRAVAGYPSSVDPQSPTLVRAIEAALAKSVA